jgi:hypothetical protein
VADCQVLLSELAVDALGGLDEKILGSLTADKKSLATLAVTETSVGITGDALQELTCRLGELTAEKRRRKVRLGELGSEIAGAFPRERSEPRRRAGAAQQKREESRARAKRARRRRRFCCSSTARLLLFCGKSGQNLGLSGGDPRL